jgi:hypothetical protein
VTVEPYDVSALIGVLHARAPAPAPAPAPVKTSRDAHEGYERRTLDSSERERSE